MLYYHFYQCNIKYNEKLKLHMTGMFIFAVYTNIYIYNGSTI